MRARLTLLSPRIGFVALLVACAAVPVAFTRITAEAFMVPKVTILRACLVVAVAGLVIDALARRRWPVPPVAARWPALALAAWTGLATLTSTAPTTSLWGQYGRYDGLLGLVAGLLTAGLVIGYRASQPRHLEALAAATLLGGAGALAYVLVQGLGLDWIEWFNQSGVPIAQPYGTVGNSNFSGAHLAMVVPLAVAAASQLAPRWQRWAMVGFAMAAAVGVVVTQTRGGLLALVVGLAGAAWLDPGPLAHRVRWPLAALSVAGLVVVASAAVLAGPADQTDGSRGLLASSTLAERREIWVTSARLVADQPLVGVGPDALGLAYPYATTSAATLNPDEAHDIFVDRAATAGLPALAAYLWLLVTVGRQAWRARTSIPPQRRWLLTGFGGVLAAYLAQGTVSIDVVPLTFMAWTSIGALIVLGDPACRAPATERARPVVLHALPLGAFAAVGVATIALLAAAVRPAIADAHLRSGQRAAAAGEPGAVVAAHFDRAIGWNGDEPRYRVRLGDQLVAIATQEVGDGPRRAALLEEALVAYDQALDLRPGDVGIRRAMARATVLLAVADPDGADAEAVQDRYDQLVAALPHDPRIRLEQGLALEQLAEHVLGPTAAARARAQAVDLLAGVRDDLPTAVGPLLGLARLAVVDGDLDEALALLDEAQRLQPRNDAVRSARAELTARIEAADP